MSTAAPDRGGWRAWRVWALAVTFVAYVFSCQAAYAIANPRIEPDVYIPIAFVNDVVSSRDDRLRDRSAGWLTMVGRLAPGASASAAATETAGVAQSLAREYPDTNRNRSAAALPEMSARTRS